jgi:predicted dinucleotide-binding enzyme
VPEEVIVVDTGNYYPSFRDGQIAAIESGETESGWVAKQLGRPVVKVFNNIMAHSLAEGGLARGTKDRIALPVAGDDPKAKGVVIALSTSSGSMESIPEASTSRGAKSPARRCTAPISTPTACGMRC